MHESKTLPNWAIGEGRNPETVRVVVRKSPALQALGTKFGATKVYTPDEWSQISAAMKERDRLLAGASAPSAAT